MVMRKARKIRADVLKRPGAREQVQTSGMTLLGYPKVGRDSRMLPPKQKGAYEPHPALFFSLEAIALGEAAQQPAPVGNSHILPVRVDGAKPMQLSAVLRKEGKLYVSWCPELDVASQGKTVEAAVANLKEAVELYMEDEDAREIEGVPIITTIEVRHGKAARALRA